MEQEHTRDYNEPCVQCSDVNWGLTEEGKFYCRSCHNVIERTREVLTGDVTSNARAQSISKGLKKKKKFDKGWEWYICEGFQNILCQQAEALQSLGVSSQMKDEVLWNFWKRYLQKSKHAHCDKPFSDATHDAFSTCESDTEVDGNIELSRLLDLPCSASDTDLISESSIGAVSSIGKSSERSVWSGSVDGSSYLSKKKKGDLLMSMPMTLAFCYLALLWLREAIMLSDLLRLVMDGHIPYLNAYKDFPEEMKMYGIDFKIFHVQSWPAYDDVHKKAHDLATYIELPRFPDIEEGIFLHPNILCMKYLMEANLPDDMHSWTCRVVEKIGIGETDFLTLHPGNKSSCRVKYDILAIAVVVVVLKILFLLDDQYEWLLSNYIEERNKNNKEGCPVFDIGKWYVVVRNAMDVEQKKLNEERVRHLWRCEKPLLYSAMRKSVILKKRQMVVDLQRQFRTLSGLMEPTEKQKPSGFQLHWTEENTAGNCFHGHSMGGILQENGNVITTLNRNYWLCTMKLCKNKCGHLTHYKESDFPHTYQFVLNLFSFLLRVQPSVIHEEVCAIENKLFSSKIEKKSRKFKTPKRRKP
ncbi:TATA box-binding protein-associated factor RNA polymerase I subunit B isoform X2 [Hemicordylus capensis]|uniref:TATA box-binding protein-associated factor RNA polymerase I subunit B isoform X2 n=1 Tax=Hemicordylus capensis TaxID=884348 RepID=UPI002303BC72|nr:TATA box-binding protein-associated factor RNA polymerase I subunit B isoform X2 [Hemicordylus capensis]